MKVCLQRVNSMCNEYNLVICADKCIGIEIRRNLPKCICGDGIKINIIVTGCEGVLCAPALPCNNVVALSSPIRIIRRNPCRDFNNSAFNNDDFDNFSEGFDNFSFNDEGSKFNDSRCCNSVSPMSREQEFAIIVRSFSPALSQFLCEFPQIFLEDNDRTVRLIFIFDKNGSCFAPVCNSGCGFGGVCGFGGCDGGFGGCGFGGGCGCGGGGFFGLAALALLFCCC